MTEHIGEADAMSRPTPRGVRVTIRPGGPDDIAPLHAVQAEESVMRRRAARDSVQSPPKLSSAIHGLARNAQGHPPTSGYAAGNCAWELIASFW
jgi:hypothetical protein